MAVSYYTRLMETLTVTEARNCQAVVELGANGVIAP